MRVKSLPSRIIRKKKLKNLDNYLIAMKNGHISCTIENLCNRFPHLSERILVHLDDQNFVKIKDASKKLNYFIQSNRHYFLRIINKYTERLDKKSWTKLVTKTTTGLIKKLAFDLVEFFKLPCVCCYERPIDYMRFESTAASRHNWHPLHIAAKLGYSELYESLQKLKISILLQVLECHHYIWQQMQGIFKSADLSFRIWKMDIFHICKMKMVGHLSILQLIMAP